VKHLAFTVVLAFAIVSAIAEPPDPYEDTQHKRFVMEMLRDDGKVLGVELVIAGPEDETRSPVEVLEKRVGLKWAGFTGGVVYRFNERSKTWEPIMTRDMQSTEVVVGKISGLKISELKTGDILVLCGPSF
jgi:hypothetical protein